MTIVACLACLYPDSQELHTCGRAVAFPAEADTLGTGTKLRPIPERPVEHYFGASPGDLGIDERYCTEPLVPGSMVTRVYHVNFVILPDDDCECSHCKTRFHTTSS